MIQNCPTCGKHGYETDDTLRALRNDVNWYNLTRASKWDLVYIDLGKIEVVAVSDEQDRDSYGSRIEDDFFIVLKTPNGRLFKREGLRNSYGDVSWGTDIREVKGEPRTVVVFDYL